MEEYLLSYALYSEILLQNRETSPEVSLTAKDIEGILQVYKWRTDREIDLEEFRLLHSEWNKTCKLLTSGNFYLTISHSDALYPRRQFLSQVSEIFGGGNTPIREVLRATFEQLETLFNDKVKTTPFLGYDYNKNPIYAMEDPIHESL